MIPYIQIEALHIGSLTISPFGILVGAAIVVGVWLSMWRGRRLGLDTAEMNGFVWAILVCGLVGGHVLDVLFYFPREFLAQPLLLVEMWNGLSSFGGFIGAVLGTIVWKYYERRSFAYVWKFQLMRPARRAEPASILPYADAVLSIFPVAWCIGRMGCTIVHDHPGILARAGSWLAVAYGPGSVRHIGFIQLRFGNQPRYDLGLLEMLFTALLALFFALTWHKRWVSGWYVAAVSLIYAPVRFAMDFLRIYDPVNGDARYAGFTPAQWACIALFAFGIVMAIRIMKGSRARPCEEPVS